MKVNEKTFYVIADQLDWKEGDSLLIGQQYNSVYDKLIHQGFTTQVGTEKIPTNIVVNEMIRFLQSNEESHLLGENYHYDRSRTIMEAVNVMNSSLVLLREMIFEEVRKERFPHLPSRQNGIWVIPQERETLKMRMNQLKTSQAKIYELNLTGTIHRADPRTLELLSLAPALLKKSAYLYWLGSEGKESPQDEIIFEGLCNVIKVIDSSSFG